MKKIYWIDLFCGAGGTTFGIQNSSSNSEVIVGVNHDENAIKSHKKNHPNTIHFTEDVRNPKVVIEINKIVKEIRKNDPNALIYLWASLECIHFSKAKGGLSRDNDSRTLANYLFMYIDFINPDKIYIENVQEFMSWGPLNKEGKPLSKYKGSDYLRWINRVKDFGYYYDSKILNSADFGSFTKRERYFGQFSKIENNIIWPEETHNPDNYKAVKEVLDLNDYGRSVFKGKSNNKYIQYSDNTLRRIYKGLLKFEDDFLTSYYGNGNCHSLDVPCNTITTKDTFAYHHITYDYSKPQSSSIEDPIGTITTVPKQRLVSWVVDTQYGRVGQKLDKPIWTLIARMDKKPIYLITAENGNFNVPIFDFDTEHMIKIKKFMCLNNISNIYIRMLRIDELLRITGFPEDYELVGTKADKLKFIGNAVPPIFSEQLDKVNYYERTINKF